MVRLGCPPSHSSPHYGWWKRDSRLPCVPPFHTPGDCRTHPPPPAHFPSPATALPGRAAGQRVPHGVVRPVRRRPRPPAGRRAGPGLPLVPGHEGGWLRGGPVWPRGSHADAAARTFWTRHPTVNESTVASHCSMGLQKKLRR